MFNRSFIGYKNKKFTNFVDSSIDKIASIFIFLISSKYFLYFTASLIASTSIFIRSIHDIGTDTAIYLYLGEKIAKGGRYYYDFFETNFPISFYIYALQYHIASFFAINPIIFSDIFINILALISLFFSARFLKKTTIYSDKIAYNLLMIGFYLGFFIRYPAIELLEFGTKSSFLAILFYPYFSLSLQRISPLSTSEKVIRGLLGGLIPCFKPHYLIYVIAIELVKWRFSSNSTSSNNQKLLNLKFFIEIDKIIIFVVGVLYLLIIWLFIPEFLHMIKIFSYYYPGLQFRVLVSRSVYSLSQYLNLIYLFPFLFFVKYYIKNNLLIAATIISSIFCILTEGLSSIDQNGAVIAVITGPIFLMARYFFGAKYFSLHKNIFSISLLIFLPFLPTLIFSGVEFSLFSSFLIMFQPVFLYYFTAKKFSQKNILSIILKNLTIQLLLCAIIGVFLSYLPSYFTSNYNNFSDVLNRKIFLFPFTIFTIFNSYFLYKNERIIEKLYQENYIFSKLLVFLFLIPLCKIIFSYVFLGYNGLAKKEFDVNKNDIIVKSSEYIKKYANNQNDRFIYAGSASNHLLFPLYNYTKKNGLPKFYILQEVGNDLKLSDLGKIFIDDNYKSTFNENNKLLFISSSVIGNKKYSCNNLKISDYFDKKGAIIRFFNQYEYVDSFYNYYLEFDIIRGQSIKLKDYVEVYVRKDGAK